MSTLHEAFARARAEDRAALIGYLPSGFPTQAQGIALATAMVEAGVDIVEVGLPYSDPLMDGPTIQAAVHQSLTAGSSVGHVLDTVAAVAATGAPTLVMSYWNPIERFGVEAFADRLRAAGGVGVITPDLTPEESDDWLPATARGPGPGVPGRPLEQRRADRRGRRDHQRLRLRGLDDGRHRRPGQRRLGGARARRPGARGHRPAGRGRPRGLHRRPGRRGGGLRRRRDRGLGVHRPDPGRPDHATALAAVRELAEELAAGVRRRA